MDDRASGCKTPFAAEHRDRGVCALLGTACTMAMTMAASIPMRAVRKMVPEGIASTE